MQDDNDNTASRRGAQLALWLDRGRRDLPHAADHRWRHVDAGAAAGAAAARVRVVDRNHLHGPVAAHGGVRADGAIRGRLHDALRAAPDDAARRRHHRDRCGPHRVRLAILAAHSVMGPDRGRRHRPHRAGAGRHRRQCVVRATARASRRSDDGELGVGPAAVPAGIRSHQRRVRLAARGFHGRGIAGVPASRHCLADAQPPLGHRT